MLEENIYRENNNMPPFGYMPNEQIRDPFRNINKIYDPSSKDEVYDPTSGLEQKLPSAGVPTEMLCMFEDMPWLNDYIRDEFRYDDTGHDGRNIHLNYEIVQKSPYNSPRERRWGNTHIDLEDEKPLGGPGHIGPSNNPGGLPNPGGF